MPRTHYIRVSHSAYAYNIRKYKNELQKRDDVILLLLQTATEMIKLGMHTPLGTLFNLGLTLI